MLKNNIKSIFTIALIMLFSTSAFAFKQPNGFKNKYISTCMESYEAACTAGGGFIATSGTTKWCKRGTSGVNHTTCAFTPQNATCTASRCTCNAGYHNEPGQSKCIADTTPCSGGASVDSSSRECGCGRGRGYASSGQCTDCNAQDKDIHYDEIPNNGSNLFTPFCAGGGGGGSSGGCQYTPTSKVCGNTSCEGNVIRSGLACESVAPDQTGLDTGYYPGTEPLPIDPNGGSSGGGSGGGTGGGSGGGSGGGGSGGGGSGGGGGGQVGTPLDTNLDGTYDNWDFTGDGVADGKDTNGDGKIDGIDLDGDGTIDGYDIDSDGDIDAYDQNDDGVMDVLTKGDIDDAITDCFEFGCATESTLQSLKQSFETGSTSGVGAAMGIIEGTTSAFAESVGVQSDGMFGAFMDESGIEQLFDGYEAINPLSKFSGSNCSINSSLFGKNLTLSYCEYQDLLHGIFSFMLFIFFLFALAGLLFERPN